MSIPYANLYWTRRCTRHKIYADTLDDSDDVLRD